MTLSHTYTHIHTPIHTHAYIQVVMSDMEVMMRERDSQGVDLTASSVALR